MVDPYTNGSLFAAILGILISMVAGLMLKNRLAMFISGIVSYVVFRLAIAYFTGVSADPTKVILYGLGVIAVDLMGYIAYKKLTAPRIGGGIGAPRTAFWTTTKKWALRILVVVAVLVGLGYFAGWKWPVSIIVVGLGIVGYILLDNSRMKYIPLTVALIVVATLLAPKPPTLGMPSFLTGWTWVGWFRLVMAIVALAVISAAALGKIEKRPAAIICGVAVIVLLGTFIVPWVAGMFGPSDTTEKTKGAALPEVPGVVINISRETNATGEYLVTRYSNRTVTYDPLEIFAPAPKTHPATPATPKKELVTKDGQQYWIVTYPDGHKEEFAVKGAVTQPTATATVVTAKTVGGFNYTAEGSYNQIYDLNKQDEAQSVKEKHSKALVVACAGVGDPEKAREACQRTTDNASEIYKILGK